MNRALAFAPLAVLALLVALSAVLLMRPGERPKFTEGLIGRAAPAYDLAPLGVGEPVTGAAMSGRPYVINMFASWCTPCRAEHPHLMALRAGGVELVGVAYKDLPEDAAAFLDELGNPYRAVGLDPEGRLGLQLGVIGMPETFVIGADGRILAVHRGPLLARDIEEVILPALAAAQ